MTIYIMDSCREGVKNNQAKLFEYLVKNVGKAVSFRDMMKALNITTSPAPIFSCLRHLEEKGKIQRVPN